MAPSRESIQNTIESYVKSVASGTVDDVLALYAPGATVEDPVGTDLRTTEESIRALYGIVEPLEQTVELGIVRIAADTAAFNFTLTTHRGERKIDLSIIDVMTFDDDAKITSMRAIWDRTDMVTR
ncbi:nuclear transport factor 2 family protein [Rhodococcus sp. T7]|uniref:nuclear transport factor 2 family protein n=1 Tax=Rhodococcus sp. T7 TaxID=627444 RepID=UPI00135841C4|nr:nuclear transport factor 2 family protein [Rhodococcus sp. T7]KAF0958005.1 Steroid Delta-isomerase [Rhodococcus sp. T7]KAF0960164.1 Steroid Delta-isomerase [Rhodococcus sp. T7]